MRRLGHGLVLAWVLWSTTSLDNDPRLLVTDWLFKVQPFPADSRPVDGWATEGECKTALERHMSFLRNANGKPSTWLHGRSRSVRGSPGSPSTRSPRMFRPMSVVPPPMVVPCTARNPLTRSTSESSPSATSPITVGRRMS